MGMDLDAEAVRDVENNINTARWALWAFTRLCVQH